MFCLIALIAAAFLSRSSHAANPPATRPVSFSQEIAPILFKQCQTCHGPSKSKGNFRLDSFDRLLKPGDSKASPIVSGKPDQSELYRLLVTDEEDDRMPKKGDPLSAEQIAQIKWWIEQGAKFDGGDRKAQLSILALDQRLPDPPEVYRQTVPITALAFSPNGSELAVNGYHEITLWHPEDGKLVGRIKKIAENTYALAYTPDGKWLAAACGTPGALGEIRICDPMNRSAGKVLERIPDIMLAARISADGKHLAAGGADNAIRVYDIATGKRELLIEQHADWVTDLAYNPDGSQLASASRDKSARVFDTKTGAMHAAFLGHEEPLFGVAWSDDAKLIFSAGRDRKVRVWTPTEAKPVDPIGGFDGEPFKLETDAGMLFVSGADGMVRQFSQDGRSLVRAYPGMSDWVFCIAVDRKNHRLAAGSYRGEVRIWDIASGKLLTTFVAAPGR